MIACTRKSSHLVLVDCTPQARNGKGASVVFGYGVVLVHVSTYQGNPFWNSVFLSHRHIATSLQMQNIRRSWDIGGGGGDDSTPFAAALGGIKRFAVQESYGAGMKKVAGHLAVFLFSFLFFLLLLFCHFPRPEIRKLLGSLIIFRCWSGARV